MDRRATAAVLNGTRRFHDSDSDDSVLDESPPFGDHQDWNGYLTPAYESDDDELDIIPPSPRSARPFRQKRGRYVVQRKPMYFTNASKKLRLDSKRGSHAAAVAAAAAKDGEISVDRAKKCGENVSSEDMVPSAADEVATAVKGDETKGASGGVAQSPPRIKLPLWPLPSASGSSKIAVVSPSPVKRPDNSSVPSAVDLSAANRHSASLVSPQPHSSKAPDFRFDIDEVPADVAPASGSFCPWLSPRQRSVLSSSDDDDDVAPWAAAAKGEPSRSNWYRVNNVDRKPPVDSLRVATSGSSFAPPRQSQSHQQQRRFPLYRSGSVKDNAHASSSRFHDSRRKVKQNADGWRVAPPHEDRRRPRWIEPPYRRDLSPQPQNHVLHCSFTLSPSSSDYRSPRSGVLPPPTAKNARQKQMFGQVLDPTVFDADLSSDSDDGVRPSTSRTQRKSFTYADSDSDFKEVAPRSKPRGAVVRVDDTSSSDESPPSQSTGATVRLPLQNKKKATVRNLKGRNSFYGCPKPKDNPALSDFDDLAAFPSDVLDYPDDDSTFAGMSREKSRLPSRHVGDASTSSASANVLAVEPTVSRRFDGNDGTSGGGSRAAREQEASDLDDSVGVIDAIQRIEQIEADEMFARQLQAQFDAELGSSNAAAEQLAPSAAEVTFLQNRAGPSSHGRLHRNHTPSTRAATSGPPGTFRSPRMRRQPAVRSPTQQSLLSGTRHRLTSGRARGVAHDGGIAPVVIGTTHRLVRDDQLNRRVIDLHNDLIGLFSTMNELGDYDGTDEDGAGISDRSRRRSRRANLRPRMTADNLLDLNFSSDEELFAGAVDFMGDFSGEDDDLTAVLGRHQRIATGSGPATRRRSRSRGQRRLRDNFTNTGNDYDLLIELTERIGNVSRGLTRTQIGRLPVREFSGKSDDPRNSQTECHICMCDYEIGERLRILPCFHSFHVHCIDRWLREKNNCPICRMDIN